MRDLIFLISIRFQRMSAQPRRELQGSLRRVSDDALVLCLSFATVITRDYRELCLVSHRFRRLVATRRASGHVCVRSSRFTDGHCAALTQSSQVWRIVDLTNSFAITDAGLASLASLAPLTSLTSLNLTWCKRITDAGVAALVPLTSLASLNLRGCEAITDAGVAALAPLTALVVHR